MSDIPRGTCRVCDRVLTLAKRGVLRHHGKPGTFPPERCDGAGRDPKERLRMGRDYTPADVFRALGEPVPPVWQEFETNRAGAKEDSDAGR